MQWKQTYANLHLPGGRLLFVKTGGALWTRQCSSEICYERKNWSIHIMPTQQQTTDPVSCRLDVDVSSLAGQRTFHAHKQRSVLGDKHVIDQWQTGILRRGVWLVVQQLVYLIVIARMHKIHNAVAENVDLITKSFKTAKQLTALDVFFPWQKNYNTRNIKMFSALTELVASLEGHLARKISHQLSSKRSYLSDLRGQQTWPEL